MKIITQGYDYALPTSKKGFGFNPLKLAKPLTNLLFSNGHWLKTPLLIKGIAKQEDQEAILYAMIYEFNEMLIDVTSKYDNVHHIDCRGICTRTDWYNEMHPESKIFKKIAKAYEKCIDGKLNKHIIVKDLD